MLKVFRVDTEKEQRVDTSMADSDQREWSQKNKLVQRKLSISDFQQQQQLPQQQQQSTQHGKKSQYNNKHYSSDGKATPLTTTLHFQYG